MNENLEFNWKSLVGTVVSTIGTVATQILGSSDEKNMVIYDFSRSTDGESSCSGVFMKRDGKTVFANLSTDENCIITLSFPKAGSATPETVTLRPLDYLDVEKYFKNAVKHDASSFMLSSSNTGAQDGGGFHIAAAGSGIKVSKTPEDVRIGNYLKVKCYPERAVFTSVNHEMEQISSVTIQGDNDSKIRSSRVAACRQEGDCVAEVEFPTPIPEGSSMEIDVEADMLNLAKTLALQGENYVVNTLNQNEFLQLYGTMTELARLRR